MTKEDNAELAKDRTALSKAALFLPIGATLLISFKLFKGVDLSDESFYAISAQSILQWHGLFVMNANVSQFACAFVAPLIFCWNLIAPSSESLMLWLRVCYIVFSAICSACLFSYAVKRTKWWEAVMLSTLPLAWVPFGIPALSYNTLGQGFLLCGLALYRCSQQTAPIERCLRALPFGLAIAAYPTLAIPVSGFLLLNLVLTDEPEIRKQAKYTVAAITVVGFAIACLLLYEGFPYFLRAIQSFHGTSQNATKGYLIHDQLLTNYFPILAPASLVLGFLTSKSKRKMEIASIYLFLLIIAIVCALPAKAMFLQSHAIIFFSAIFLLPQVIFQQTDRFTKFVFLFGIIAGLSVATSSHNGFMNFCIGFFPALCLTLCHVPRFEKDNQFAQFTGNVFRATIVGTLLFFSITYTYGDDSNGAFPVAGGKFNGLATTEERSRLIRIISDDIASVSKNKQTIYVIGPPGYYLCTNLKPLDLRTFHLSGDLFEPQRPLFDQFYAMHGNPDLILHVPIPYFGELNSFDEKLLKSGYVCSVKKPNYSIYMKQP